MFSTYLDPDGDQMLMKWHRKRILELDERKRTDSLFLSDDFVFAMKNISKIFCQQSKYVMIMYIIPTLIYSYFYLLISYHFYSF